MGKIESVYGVIKSPLITEKATRLNSLNKYIFLVDKRSNKIDIRRAVEHVYKVKVRTVNVISVKGKMKRLRAKQEGKTPSWKKAVVTLKPGEQIKLT